MDKSDKHSDMKTTAQYMGALFKTAKPSEFQEKNRNSGHRSNVNAGSIFDKIKVCDTSRGRGTGHRFRFICLGVFCYLKET